MRRHACRAVVAIAMLDPLSTVARGAPPKPNATVTVEAAGCRVAVDHLSTADLALVEVVAPPGETIRAVTGRAVTPPAEKTIASLQRADVQGKVVVVQLGAGERRCPLATALFEAEDSGRRGSSSAPSDDAQAQASWLAGGQQEMKRVRDAGEKLGLPSDAQFLVHLPSGNRIFPSPAAITEGVPLQIAVLLRQDDPREISARLDSCEAVDTVRVLAGPGTKLAPGEEAAGYVLRPVDAYFRCGAGTIRYRLSIAPAPVAAGTAARPQAAGAARSGGAAPPTGSNAPGTQPQGAKDAGPAATDEGSEFTLRVRPRYHLAGIVALGYDWGKRPTFETRPDPAGGAATVARIDETVGAIGYVGAQWMMGGVDYEEMRWYNYFANPFLAVNVSNPTKDVVAGLALTPTGGLSLAIGASLHMGRRLKNGLREGDPFTGSGDVPTADTWSGVQPGLFLGLAVDTRVSDAVGKRFGGSSSGN